MSTTNLCRKAETWARTVAGLRVSDLEAVKRNASTWEVSFRDGTGTWMLLGPVEAHCGWCARVLVVPLLCEHDLV